MVSNNNKLTHTGLSEITNKKSRSSIKRLSVSEEIENYSIIPEEDITHLDLDSNNLEIRFNEGKEDIERYLDDFELSEENLFKTSKEN